MKLSSKLALAAAALLASTSVAATNLVTFATYSSTANGTNFRWVRSANTVAGNHAKNATFYTTATAHATAAGATNVAFFFKDLGGFSSFFNAGIPAKLLLSGTVTNTPATLNGATVTQTLITGTFAFTANNTVTYGNISGTNLLSGTFSQLTFTGTNGGSSGAINGSTGGGSSITYTSDFLTFAGSSTFDIGLTLTSIAPLLSFTSNRALPSFRAVITGNFSSNPAPLPPSIPEPGTWAMMIAGMGLVGFARRRRRVAVAA
jgi:hypothetical protein